MDQKACCIFYPDAHEAIGPLAMGMIIRGPGYADKFPRVVVDSTSVTLAESRPPPHLRVGCKMQFMAGNVCHIGVRKLGPCRIKVREKEIRNGAQ
jgi:hypothetical protein